jgi:hypothetical protein
MLKCKDVAHLASDYLDKNIDGTLTLRIRLHLILCANCRRFVRHLRITNTVAAGLVKIDDDIDAEAILKRIKEKNK